MSYLGYGNEAPIAFQQPEGGEDFALASSPIRQWPIVIVTQAGVRSSTRSCQYTGGTTVVVSMVLHTVDGGNRWGMVSSLL
jgi:hypothetical protein